MSFSISDHENSNRVRVIKLQESDLDRLIFPFKKHTILSLEYKPFSRFSLAKSLDEVFQNKLSKTLCEILNDRKTGTAIVDPDIKNKKFDKDLKYGQERENRIVSILDKDKTKMEVKTERDWWFKTNNIAIEVECYGKPSGIMATEADYWVHILANGDKDYCRLILSLIHI